MGVILTTYVRPGMILQVGDSNSHPQNSNGVEMGFIDSGYIIPLILTFDPNFQRHIQVLGLYYTQCSYI